MPPVSKDLKRIKDKVAALLERYPVTRDSDKHLWIAYMIRFGGLKKVIPNKEKRQEFADMILGKDTPTFESIRRVRQKFQEGGKFLGKKRLAKLEEEGEVRTWAKTTKY